MLIVRLSAVNDYRNANLKFWNSVVAEHVESDFYDVAGFLDGAINLDDIEMNQVGDVRGKTLLHLQCHFGLSTLSLVRMGALATGVDFSPDAIEAARRLSQESGLSARFVESNIYDISDNLDEQYDIVFTSYGVLCWLPDLGKWAEQIACCLKDGGRFHLVEYHPLMTALESGSGNDVVLRNSYFNEGVEIFEVEGSYASPKSFISETTYEWNHSIGEVITALVNVGLNIDTFNEYPYATDGGFVGYLRRDEDKKWRVPDHKWGVPLTYSISASK